MQEFIDTLKKLKEVGVDVTKISTIDTIKTLSEKSGIGIEKIEEIGLELNNNIGRTKLSIIGAYRGTNNSKKPTEKQVEELKKLGISLEKRDKVQEFIDTLKKLREAGVDVTKIINIDTIETLSEKSGIGIEKIEEIGLDPNNKIGNIKKGIIGAYRGTKDYKKPTEKQVEELKELGISLEKQEQDTVQEFIDNLKKLRKAGVDVTKIINIDTIETLSEKSGIGIEKIEEIGLEPNNKIGNIKKGIIGAYKGTNNSKKPTKKQVEELKRLGVSLEERDTVQEFIDTLKKLKEAGVDVTKISTKDTIETLSEKSGIGIEKIEEIGLELNNNIGRTKLSIIGAYRGTNNYKKPTKKQVEELKRLGISLESKRRTGKEVVAASISAVKDIDMLDEESAALSRLIYKAKEGEYHKNE